MNADRVVAVGILAVLAGGVLWWCDARDRAAARRAQNVAEREKREASQAWTDARRTAEFVEAAAATLVDVHKVLRVDAATATGDYLTIPVLYAMRDLESSEQEQLALAAGALWLRIVNGEDASAHLFDPSGACVASYYRGRVRLENPPTEEDLDPEFGLDYTPESRGY